MKNIVILVCFILVVFFGFSQQVNTPPNARLKTKLTTASGDSIFQKLNESPQITSDSISFKAKPLKDLSESEWQSLEATNPDEYAYYIEALNYYNELSSHVKSTLTSDELWNIYFFNPDLKQELLNY